MAASGLFLLSARVSVAAPERRELVQALSAWLTLARGSTGFVSGHIAEDLEVACAYAFTSAWGSQEDLDTHLLGPDFGALLGALEVLGHDEHMLLTAALDGSVNGWIHVHELRARHRHVQDGITHALSGESQQPATGGPA